MPDAPWITIAIPSYNRAELLERAIESVRNQTDTGWELFITDDGSSDGAWERAVAAEGRDARIHAERNPQNLGLAKNFRFASEHGTAPYLLLLAADDFLDPTFLMRVREVITEQSDLGLICGRRVHYIARTGKKRFYDTPLVGRFEAGRTTARALRNGNLYGLYSSVVVRRVALEDVGGIREDNPWAGDYEAWVRIAARRPIYFLHQAMLFQHIDGSTQTSHFVESGQLVRYEAETLDRLLADAAVQRAINTRDQEAAQRRIVALHYIIRLYLMFKRSHGKVNGSPGGDTAFGSDFVETVPTIMRLLWNRWRLSY